MPDYDKEFYTARGYEMAADENALTPSMEDYIEMIFRMSIEQGQVRVNDLAEKLNVQPPSVTKMIQKLSDKMILHYEKYGMIQLTDAGMKLGKFFLERHNVVKEFLFFLGIKENLQKNVEQMEHYVGWNTFEAMKRFVHFLQDNPHVLIEYNRYIQQ